MKTWRYLMLTAPPPPPHLVQVLKGPLLKGGRNSPVAPPPPPVHTLILEGLGDKGWIVNTDSNPLVTSEATTPMFVQGHVTKVGLLTLRTWPRLTHCCPSVLCSQFRCEWGGGQFCLRIHWSQTVLSSVAELHEPLVRPGPGPSPGPESLSVNQASVFVHFFCFVLFFLFVWRRSLFQGNRELLCDHILCSEEAAVTVEPEPVPIFHRFREMKCKLITADSTDTDDRHWLVRNRRR